jgi:hypothetical protein
MSTTGPRGRPGSEANDVELPYCMVSASKRELLVRVLTCSRGEITPDEYERWEQTMTHPD